MKSKIKVNELSDNNKTLGEEARPEIKETAPEKEQETEKKETAPGKEQEIEKKRKRS